MRAEMYGKVEIYFEMCKNVEIHMVRDEIFEISSMRFRVKDPSARPFIMP